MNKHRIMGTDIWYTDEPCKKGQEEGRARICGICGEPKAMADMAVNGHGYYEFECAQCKRARNKSNYDKGRKDNTLAYWTKRVAASRFADEKKGRQCNITPEYILGLYNAQKGRCAYTGKKCDTLSIERIDNNLGHVKGNIILVDNRLNVMRGAQGQDEFLLMCYHVAHHMEDYINGLRNEEKGLAFDGLPRSHR